MHSYPIYQDYQKRAEPLAEVLCRRLIPASVSIDNQHRAAPGRARLRNYFSMLGGQAGDRARLQLAGRRSGLSGAPGRRCSSYDYWVSRFARDPESIGKKILVNDSPMTIVGVSAAGFAGIDPAQSPQIRVPILMKPVMTPEWTGCTWTTARPMGPGIRATEAGLHGRIGGAPLQGLFTQIRTDEMTLPGAKDWSAIRAISS